MTKVSVIVPIYNVEKYIERCVRSLMEQSLKELEYIFVDDCSPDHAMDILETVVNEYPDRLPYIKIIRHSKNSGSAVVRNTGLRCATGEYVIYCDSDDWVERNAYEAMYSEAKETGADIVATDYYIENRKSSAVRKQEYSTAPYLCVKKMLSVELHCGTWNKLVKRELYIRNEIRFPDGINMWEDVLTVIPLFCFASTIVYLPHAYYHYVQYNTSSYTKQMSEKSLINLIEAIEYLDDFFKAHHLQQFEHDFNYTKLTAKLNLLLHSKGKLQKDRALLYPEADSCIWSHKEMSVFWRLALQFTAWRIYPAYAGLIWLGKKIQGLK